MRLVRRPPVVGEGRCPSACQPSITHEQVDGHAEALMLDDLPAPLALWRRGVLALPVEVMFVDPVIQASYGSRYTEPIG